LAADLKLLQVLLDVKVMLSLALMQLVLKVLYTFLLLVFVGVLEDSSKVCSEG
jgi:hypothetical protein